MKSTLACLLLLVSLSMLAKPASGLWKLFDFVRTKANAWGSPGRTAFRKINGVAGNGPAQITTGSRFGFSLANIGDLDGDGVQDLLVGAPGESNTYYNATSNTVGTAQLKSGAVYVLFMTLNGTVRNSLRIAGSVNGGPRLYEEDAFGYSVSALGDVDGDGVADVAVGAPGIYVSSVYVLFMRPNGTARALKLIRGAYRGTLPLPELDASFPSNFYVPNGPELAYGARLGTALAPLGDWDKDGVPDLCASTYGISSGENVVYMLFLNRDGTVKRHVSISQGVNGGPVFGQGVESFSGFGSSMLVMPDSNGDGVPEMVFGAKDLQDEGTSHLHSGVLWYCFMKADATIDTCTRISELSAAKDRGGVLPYTADDNCGVGVTQIGDINKDDKRSHWPLLPRPRGDARASVVDLVVGCPQTDSAADPGRLFFLYLATNGAQQGHTLLPAATDRGIAPQLQTHEHLGASLAALQDLDNNGMQEVAAGAPGDVDGGKDSGAVFVLYFRRRRWHSFVPDTRSWLATIIIPPSIAVVFCIAAIVYFCWTYRRKPDEIEVMIIKAGVEIGGEAVSVKKKKRRKDKGESKQDKGVVYADDF